MKQKITVKEKMNKKILFSLFKFIFLIIILGSIIGLLYDTKIFYRNAIVDKYCYFEKRKGEYVYVNGTKRKNEALREYYHYKKIKEGILDTPYYRIAKFYFVVPYFKKIDVLFYNEDSTLAYIRAEYKIRTRPFNVINRGFVPVITLHDTLPRCFPNCFPEIEWFITDSSTYPR